MAEARIRMRWVGALVGAVLVVGAVLAVIFVEFKPEEEEEGSPPIRPLKSMVVRSSFIEAGRKYPGKVKASQEVSLAFQVDGPLVEFPLLKGQEVKAGDLLARIDPRDCENKLAGAQALYDRTQANLERIERSAASGAVSQTDLTNARAAFQQAEANLKIARKALEDTELRAPFDGRVANTFVENYENVQAKQVILSLQDISQVDIEVAVPEDRMAMARKEDLTDVEKYVETNTRFVATFDYLPGREFEVEVKEYTTEADPLTQTYQATLTMPAPEDVTILPGMTATIQEFFKSPLMALGKGIPVPLDAVPVDGAGNYFVWTLKEQDGGIFTVHRAAVKVGEVFGDVIIVQEGLRAGERIATAGVHFLVEGQQVRLLARRGGEPR